MAIPSQRTSKKKPSTNKKNGPSAKQQNHGIAKAIAAIEHTLADKADTNRKEDSREDTGNKYIAIATLIFVVFTTFGIFVQAYILHNSDKTFKQTMIASTRAWIAPSRAEMGDKFLENGEMSFTIYYGNVGKEPALGFVAQQEINSVIAPNPNQSLYTVFPSSALKDICGETHASDGAGVIYPSGLGEHRYTVFAKAGPFELPNLQEVVGRTRAIFIHGCFAYFTFGIERKSEYCFLRLPIIYADTKEMDFRFVRCPYGNDIHEPKTKTKTKNDK